MLQSSQIKSLRVYPPLGIARVGNAEDSEIYAAEVIGGPPTLSDGSPAVSVDDFRDAGGAIKRQAVRFRIYAELIDGSVCEVTLDDQCQIRWTVAVANLKAGWYNFENAMDLVADAPKPAGRRNAAISQNSGDRGKLDIVPSPVSISGASKSGAAYHLASGQFMGNSVYLGEARTDTAGRLIFLGGHGLSAPAEADAKPTTFANNDGWHDDVSDGPIRAVVTFSDGVAVEAEAGYVVVTPPNFAPGLLGLVTMDDTVRETFYAKGWLHRPAETSFTRDIWPIFARMTALQWVNQGHYILSGTGSSLDAHDPTVFAKLCDQTDAGKPWRQTVRSLFRSAEAAMRIDTGELAQVYSDYFGDIPGADLAPAGLALTPTMLDHLDQWVAGNVIDDSAELPQLADFGTLTPQAQIDHLERAALTECLGGPFHPGIELTWTMRLASLWERPYRLRISPTGFSARQDFGDILTPAACLAANGPYDGVAAGALTRFMGVPWQTDEASCNSGADYTPTYFLSLPTYWGARVPDQVLSLEHYLAMQLSDANAPVQAIKHLSTRSDWLRDVRGRGYAQRIANMVREWHELGLVLPKGEFDPRFGGPARVEQGRSPDHIRGDPQPGLMTKILKLSDSTSAQGPLMAGVGAVEVSEGLQSLPGTPRRAFRRGEI